MSRLSAGEAVGSFDAKHVSPDASMMPAAKRTVDLACNFQFLYFAKKHYMPLWLCDSEMH